jgi:D-3-phosphoglycerate dehydrogenase
MKHVLIPTKLDSIAREILEKKKINVVQDGDTPLMDLVKANPETQALIVRSEKVTKEIIDALPKLRLIVRAGAGYNTIDTKYARKAGVDVMNTPGANANAVAEEVLALVLAYFRHVVPADQSTRAGGWEKKKFMGRELAEKTVGVVGLGNIGQLVVKRLEGFDCRILAYDPVIAMNRAKELGVKIVSLEELFRQADIITLHVPETNDTRGMVNKDLLGLMKEGAVIVNCARAGVLVEEDLRQVKKEKKIGFLNDVYAEDAAGEKSVADVADIMLPHLGASTKEANSTAARRAAEQLIAYAERGVTKFVVNKGVPDGLDEAYQQLAYLIAVVARRYLGTEESVRRIECSFYGDLQQYAKWFLSPVVAGISTDFDAVNDPEEAQEYLAGKGVAYEVREVAPEKRYDNSMTIDLLEGEQQIRQVSVRGTITEGKQVVSRINDFDGLYFQPHGNSVVVVYRDQPGVLAKITSALASDGINIDDMRSVQGGESNQAIAVLKTNREVGADTMARIRQETGAEVAFALSLP